ncbi:MAG TPA: hypothetical protein VGE07_00965 [Herpetosiphonaceae bacterium]
MAQFKPARRRQRTFGDAGSAAAGSLAGAAAPAEPHVDPSGTPEELAAALEQLDATVREATAAMETLATQIMHDLDEIGRSFTEIHWDAYYEHGAPYGNTEAGLKRWIDEQAAAAKAPPPEQELVADLLPLRVTPPSGDIRLN